MQKKARLPSVQVNPAFINLVKNQILWYKCVHHVRRDDGSAMVEVRIGDYAAAIDEYFLQSIVAPTDVKAIKLVIAKCPDIPAEICALLAKYISPKLVEIHVVDCPDLGWNSHIKRILEACGSTVDHINLCRNKWVNDWVIEQIAVKFSKCLRVLDLEATSASDQALHHVGRRCLNLRVLTLNMCHKISDDGLSQIAKKVHLSSLHISHNLMITDVGLEVLISAAHNLESIELKNCPKVTDRAMEAMFEAVVAWGKRRNTKSVSLKNLVLADCVSLTRQSLVFLAASVPNLMTLDIRNCVGVNLVTGMREMETLKNLQGLMMGPTSPLSPTEASDLMQSVLFHVSGLKVLHILEFNGFDDDMITELIDGAVCLEELVLVNMPFGIHTVESICSNVPNLKSLTMEGTSLLCDADVRCLSSVLLHVQSFTFKKCQSLTDEAFARSAALSKLTHLDLTQVSKKLTGSFMTSLTMAPLKTLILDGLSLQVPANAKLKASTTSYASKSERKAEENRIRPKWGECFALLSTMTCQKIEHISLQNCPHVSDEDLISILSKLPNCNTVDVTGSGQTFPASLNKLSKGLHPFLKLRIDAGFVGFAQDLNSRLKHVQSMNMREMFQRHGFARTIQKCIRKYNERMRKAKDAADGYAAALRNHAATLIQAVVRSKQARKRFMVRLLAGRKLVHQARRFLLVMLHRRYVQARTFYKNVLKRLMFSNWRLHTEMSIVNLHQGAGVAMKLKSDKRLMRRIYMDLIAKEGEHRDERLYQAAIALWEGHTLRKVIATWKTVRGETLYTRWKVTRKFMLVAELKCQNSSRELALRAMSDNFLRRKQLVVSWICINDDFIRAKKANLLFPRAIEYFEDTFFKRVVRAAYGAIVWFRESKRIKRTSLAAAPKIRRAWQWFNGARYLFEERARRLLHRRDMNLAVPAWQRFWLKRAVGERLQTNVFFEKFLREIDIKQSVHWCEYKSKYYFKEMKSNVIKLRHLKGLEFLAEVRFGETYRKRYFMGWKAFMVQEANAEEIVFHAYCLKWAEKCIAKWKIAVVEAREYQSHVNATLLKQAGDDVEARQAEEAARLSEEIRKAEEEAEREARGDHRTPEEVAAEKAAEEAAKEALRLLKIEQEKERIKEAKLLLIARVTLFQAVCRGALQRVHFNDLKISVFTAVQTLQNYCRRILAVLRCNDLRQKLRMRRYISEERETQEMWRMDQFSQLFRTCSSMVLLIQRIYRGHRGRIKAAIDAYEIARERGVGWYDYGAQFRANLAALRLEMERQAKRLYNQALIIQKRVRGIQGRIRFRKAKAQSKKVYLTTCVQRDYRRRLAEFQLKAMRRDKFTELRVRTARAQKGLLLRAAGFPKRRQQAVASIALESLGIDPLSYNYRINELWAETKKDFLWFVEIIKREWKIFRSVGLSNTNKILRVRRSALHEKGLSITTYDAVRIIDPLHPYAGMTGLVVRIDTSIPGTPLYEVKLDSTNKQTFVNMTRDALYMYTQTQPLCKIDPVPKLEGFVQNFVMFGLNEGDPMFSRKNINAAWTMQCAFRMHRSRKIVARRRYELWLRSGDRQANFFAHLAETNSLTMQANNILNFMGVRPAKPVFFDEVRHPTLSGRYDNSTHVKNELKSLKLEFNQKYRERLLYLQQAAVIEGKEYFSKGFEKISKKYKLKMASRRIFGYKPPVDKVTGKPITPKDLVGLKGAQAIANDQLKVKGIDAYDFTQFLDSPHIRYYKSYIFQGEWSGIPLFTPLKPHGEGLLLFFDGWGFAREEKVVFLQICCCRHLNAADTTTSDPYCVVSCNGTVLSSTVKWKDLNPVYDEKFEIDVTNAFAKLNITVFDKDYIGSDDFLGQIEVRLDRYADGKEHHEVFQLQGEDLDLTEDFDRGEIEIRIRWAPRRLDSDLLIEEIQWKQAIIIQAWARRIAALTARSVSQAERTRLLLLVRKRAVQITNTCRIRIAVKKRKALRRRWVACLKIQKRARIRQARLKYKALLRRKYAAIDIQRIMRGYLAHNIVKRIKQANQDGLDAKATVIQKHMRRVLATKRVNLLSDMRKAKAAAQKENGNDDEEEDDDAEAKAKVQAWVKVYGCDPDPMYKLRRNRRMTEAYFQKILKSQYIRLVSKYGVVYVDEYPARKSDEDMAAEKAGGACLTDREAFVGVYFPQFRVMGTHREEAMEFFTLTPHFGTLHIASSVKMRETVFYNIITIQCAVRQRQANAAKNKILKLHASFSKFQRIFRRRHELLNKKAVIITALFHVIHSKKVVQFRRREINSAWCIQRSFRCYYARCAAFDRRCITNISVLKYSSAMPFHGPAKALAFKAFNFWMSDSPELAEVRVEMSKLECVTEIWVQTSTNDCSPKYCSISCVTDKKAKQYKSLVENSLMSLTRGPRWHKFEIGDIVAKYYKLTFKENYGDGGHIAIRQIRFMRARERSPKILLEPLQHIMTAGPTIGRLKELTLSCPASAWPPPTYQWFRNGILIPNATQPDLKLYIKCPLDFTKRSFRCLKCKMFSRNIPNNAYYIKCNNCNALFNFKEIKEYDKCIADFKKDEVQREEEQAKLLESKEQISAMEGADTDSNLISLLEDINTRIKVCASKLQELREARYSAKGDLQFTNRFSDEGIYICKVTNIRGGSIQIVRTSVRAVVVVENYVPYVALVKPYYRPRPQDVRKKWTTYHSMLGTFTRGVLEGLVLIRFTDASFYEGPYIDEKWLDVAGRVMPEARAHNHYGVFRSSDGKTYEGKMVDNHFDPLNLQSFYRVSMPNKEVYEGMFCDELYHGTGIYKFKDGSVYEGHWHRGTRFGHGHMRSKEGWTYEGGFNNNKRHGNGCISYPDGSMYLGDWYYDKQDGYGVIITALRDVYRGQVKDGRMHGWGSLLYADGSKHTGLFRRNLRHGRGIFHDSDGTQSYGTYIDDNAHGEHIVKAMIPIEEVGQQNFEVRIGVYEMSKFIKWKLKYSNPLITKRFIALFKENDSMFDSVYSMVIAKNLPQIPEGVDRNHPDVVEILTRIRSEAGNLVGAGALMAAQAEYDRWLVPIKALRKDIEKTQVKIDKLAIEAIEIDKEAADLMRRYQILIGVVEKDSDRVEQFWIEDPSESRAMFQSACANLNTVEVNQYFTFRNHRIPPPFTKKIMDAISILLGLSTSWKAQQLIISTSIVNGREGDDLGLRFDFDCKLAFIMQKMVIYDYTRVSEGSQELESILCDPRLRRDSYYVESCGPAGPVLVDWIKAMYLYLAKSRHVFENTAQVEEKKVTAFRLRAQSLKLSEQVGVIRANVDALKVELASKEEKLLDLDETLAKVADMLEFISANNYKRDTATSNKDYYKEMEDRIEAKRDFFVVETCMQFICEEVGVRREMEIKIKIREALAKGDDPKLVEENLANANGLIKDWIMEEVREQQYMLVYGAYPRSLGYDIEPQEWTVSMDETQEIINMIALRIIGKLNDKYNDRASALSWTTLKGKKFNQRFVYVYAWKYWEQEGVEAKELGACAAWEEAWKEPEMCAKMAIEAKVNERMSEVAREQGRIWASRHKMETLVAERLLSEQFEVEFTTERGKIAMEIRDDPNGTMPPATKALAISWIRLNPEEVSAAKDTINEGIGEEFKKNFGDRAVEVAVRIFNGFAEEDELVWEQHAVHWKSFNTDIYVERQARFIDEQRDAFAEEFPNFTAVEAASVMENFELSKLVTDAEVREELTVSSDQHMRATCWGQRNQGILKAARAQLDAKNEKKLSQLWPEIEQVTDGWRKGAYNTLTRAMIKDVKLDRFHGFRFRLLNKFAWVYGYLNLRYIQLFKEIEAYDSTDPMGKVLHNIRPSTFEKYKRNIEDSFLKRKKQVESAVTDIVAKLSTWHTYFGLAWGGDALESDLGENAEATDAGEGMSVEGGTADGERR